MSGGRVELGIGTGWYDDEHPAYGIPFPPLGERFDRLEEQLAIITGLWATPAGETFTFDGQPLPGDRLARRCPSRCSSRARRSSSAGAGAQAHAARWRRATPPSSTCRSRRSTASPTRCDRVRAACEAIEPRPDVARVLGRAGRRVLRATTRPRSSAGPTAIGRQPDELRANGAAGHARRGRRDARGLRRRRRARGCTSRCSTSTTSTTSPCSAAEVMPSAATRARGARCSRRRRRGGSGERSWRRFGGRSTARRVGASR